MVDVTTEESVDDELLASLELDKGGRRVLASADERSLVLETLDDAGNTTKITPGGSLANTLVGVARLSKASATRQKLHVALGGSCSSDALGQFFSSQLAKAGVAVIPSSDTGGTTGTVFVLPSEDAQRSFLSFFQSEQMTVPEKMKTTIANARLVLIEGYLWEQPNAAEAIAEVVATARANGTRVALTAGDPGVVARHGAKIIQVLKSWGQDILLFANKEEACTLQGDGHSGCPLAAAKYLGSLCSIAVVTDGGNGSHVSCMGQLHSLGPAHAPLGVVDTCGAGDAYAAGFCYALMTGHDGKTSGSFASAVAARVIGRHGAQLQEEEAAQLVRLLPVHTPPPASAMRLGSGAMSGTRFMGSVFA